MPPEQRGGTWRHVAARGTVTGATTSSTPKLKLFITRKSILVIVRRSNTAAAMASTATEVVAEAVALVASFGGRTS